MVHNPPIQRLSQSFPSFFFQRSWSLVGLLWVVKYRVDFTSCSIEIGRRILDGFHSSTPRDEATVRFIRAGHLWERCGEKGVLGCERFFVNATFFGTKDTQMRRIVFWYLFWLSWKCITNADHFWTLLDEDSPLGGIQKNGLRSVFLMSSFLATCGTKSDVIWWFLSSVFFRWKHAETLGWRYLGEPSSYKCQLPYGKTLGTYHCVTSNPRNLPNLYVAMKHGDWFYRMTGANLLRGNSDMKVVPTLSAVETDEVSDFRFGWFSVSPKTHSLHTPIVRFLVW